LEESAFFGAAFGLGCWLVVATVQGSSEASVLYSSSDTGLWLVEVTSTSSDHRTADYRLFFQNHKFVKKYCLIA